MKKKILVIMSLVAMATISTVPVAASENIDSSCVIQRMEEDYGVYGTDVIEYRYRVLSDGTLQYRRWNATKNVWVDPYWIDC